MLGVEWISMETKLNLSKINKWKSPYLHQEALSHSKINASLHIEFAIFCANTFQAGAYSKLL